MAMKLTCVGTLVLIIAAAHADEKFPQCFNASREGALQRCPVVD